MRRIITFGTFDLLHVGHVNVLRRARAMGDRLIVGVSSDELNLRKKGVRPTYPLAHRLEIVQAVRWVDDIFVEHALEAKRDYIRAHRATVLVMGDDWTGRFDEFRDACEVEYLPRTPGISSSEVKRVIQVAPGTFDFGGAASAGLRNGRSPAAA